MTPVEKYNQNQSKSIQPKLELLRETIRDVAPEVEEVISYNMPAFKQNKVLVYYAVNKNHIGFYPTPNPILHFSKELASYKTSKGAVQFLLDQPLPLSLITEMVQFRANEIL